MASATYSLNENGIPRFEDLPLLKADPPHSAWGLYGKNDELGTLNRLTDERVVAAARAEIQSGVRLVILCLLCFILDFADANLTGPCTSLAVLSGPNHGDYFLKVAIFSLQFQRYYGHVSVLLACFPPKSFHLA